VKKLALGIAAVLLSACSRDIQNTEAVRQSVIDYLRSRTTQTGLNMDMMQVDVTSVSFDRNEARAAVSFRPKNGGGDGGMQMNYILQRKGNQWVVAGRSDNSSNPHGAGGMPELPPTNQLPPGHPAIGSKQ
jgi:hypothetical protein